MTPKLSWNSSGHYLQLALCKAVHPYIFMLMVVGFVSKSRFKYYFATARIACPKVLAEKAYPFGKHPLYITINARQKIALDKARHVS